MVEGAVEMALASMSMAWPARPRANAFPIIASTAFVVATFARARVTRAVLRKRGKDWTGRAGRLPVPKTPTTNAIPANATALAHAIKRNRLSRMGRLARLHRNACLAIVSTASVAIRPAWEHAKHVRQPKKAAASAELVETSSSAQIRKASAPMARVPERAHVNMTMVCLARRRRNVCRAIASTAFAVTKLATERVRRVRLRRKAAEATAYVVSLRAARIQTMTAHWCAMLQVGASKRLSERCVHRLPIAYRASVPMDSAATPRAMVHAKHVACQVWKVRAPMGAPCRVREPWGFLRHPCRLFP